MKMPATPEATIPAVVRIAFLLACAGGLSACFSIPERAWRNGEGMSQSRAYQAVLSGDMSIKAHQEFQSSIDPRRVNFREVAYPAFGQWWP
jgi:hypothetical protein